MLELEPIPAWIKSAIRIGNDLAEQDTVIRYLQDCVNAQAEAAVKELLDVNPLDAKRIAWLQGTAKRAEDFARWIADAAVLEENALQALEEIDKFNAHKATDTLVDG